MLEANALPSRLAHPAMLEAWAIRVGVAASGSAFEADARADARATERAAEQTGACVLQRLRDALERLGGQAVSGEAILHRHVSAAMLSDAALGLGWIESPDDPALALCTAPPPLFTAVQRAAGLMMLGPGIRQVISRSDLVLMEQQIGPESMDFVRRVAPRLWIGGTVARVDAAEISAQALAWGGQLLARAWAIASPPVARRGMLRLPPEVGAVAGTVTGDEFRPGRLSGRLPAPAQALALARAILHELDAVWLSHFPAPR